VSGGAPGGGSPLQFTPQQVAALERLGARGFAPAAWPMYERQVGVRKGNCAALLAPVEGGGFRIAATGYLVAGQLGVKITRGERMLYVWKKHEIEATPDREAELQHFVQELRDALLAAT